MKKFSTILFLIVHAIFSMGQNPNSGPQNSIYLNGAQNLDIGDEFNDLELPITVEAWLKMDESLTDWGPVFVSQEGDPLTYYGFWLFAKKDGLSIGYGDGFGGYHHSFRRSKTWTTSGSLAGRWVHVVGIIRSMLDMDLYVNGINIGGSYTGSSNQPMVNGAGQMATIGKDDQNTKVYYYQGEIDELRVWNRSRTQSEIRQDMSRKLSGGETGLVGYWRFDQNVMYEDFSLSQNHIAHDGSLGLPSGAPVGDNSTFLYTSTWVGQEVSQAIQSDNLKISEIVESGMLEGLQIYWTDGEPNSITNLPGNNCKSDYFYGIFQASIQSQASQYILSETENSSRLFNREDNTKLLWSEDFHSNEPRYLEASITSSHQEFVNGGEAFPEISFEDRVICEGEHVPYILDESYDYELNNVPISNSFTIDAAGEYTLKTIGECDSYDLTAQFGETELPYIPFSDLIEHCFSTPLMLSVNQENVGVEWFNDESSKEVTITEPGDYSVRVFNECGSILHNFEVKANSIVGDVEFSDGIICEDPLFFTLDNQFEYSLNGENISSDFSISEGGSYELQVSADCNTKLFNAEFLKVETPRIDLPETLEHCFSTPLSLEINQNDVGVEWFNGSLSKSIEVSAPGSYDVSVFNECGSMDHTIIVEPAELDIGMVPNIITPNDDGLNDTFIVDSGNVEFSLKVLNRWGKEIAYFEEYDNKWDASNVGKGVYYIFIQEKCGERFYKGSLTVIK